MNRVVIDKPGMFTTIQDLGRYGHQRYGVPVNGPMDEAAHRIANALVGNPEHAAVLECTLTGPTLRFLENALVAFCGADFHITANGQTVPLNRAVVVRAGVTLTVQERRSGARLYLAVRGGFDVPKVLDSRSTFVRGGFGGLDGRALRAGDRIAIADVEGPIVGVERLLIQSGLPLTLAGEVNIGSVEAVSTADDDVPDAGRPLRVMRGPQWRAFEREARLRFRTDPYSVSNRSDRMGYRLQGAPLNLRTPLEMVSEAVNIGTVQVPPDGQPIVLMADRQTAGGYPKIAYVITADLPLLAQAAPGDALTFAVVTHRQAERAYLDQEARIARIAQDALAALK